LAEKKNYCRKRDAYFQGLGCPGIEKYQHPRPKIKAGVGKEKLICELASSNCSIQNDEGLCVAGEVSKGIFVSKMKCLSKVCKYLINVRINKLSFP
jgi:hypothetical protein